MPIQVNSEIRVFDHDEFHQLAEQVLGIVFGIHNEYGRLLNEETYKNLISLRCKHAGISPISREVEIRVTFQGFMKRYLMDSLLKFGLMIESKTAEQLASAHHAQALNYLLLTGMKHGLLVNLRPDQVEKRFISTSLDIQERRRFQVVDNDWLPKNEASHRLLMILLELLNDWGAFLEISLYREALMHFFGAGDAVRRVPIYDQDIRVGSNDFFLIAPDTAVAITALKDNTDSMTHHLQRLFNHTRLAYFQWINMNNHLIEFRTIVRG